MRMAFQHKVESIADIGQSFKMVKGQTGDMETRFISIDPIMRVWLSGAKTYLPALKNGDTIHAFALSSPINKEEYYFGSTGIQTQFMKSNAVVKIPRKVIAQMQKQNIPVQYLLAMIMNGLPSYFGLINVCKIKKGQKVVISAAAGATGLFCIQLALIMGCQVIALTGADNKVQFLKKEFPTITVLNYKEEGWHQNLEMIDAYFDNVGEEMLDLMLTKMNNNGKIALCGSMGSSHDFNKRAGLQNAFLIISKRIKMKGFTLQEDLDKIQIAFNAITEYVFNGHMKVYVETLHSLEEIPIALQKVFRGENIGKFVVEVPRL